MPDSAKYLIGVCIGLILCITYAVVNATWFSSEVAPEVIAEPFRIDHRTHVEEDVWREVYAGAITRHGVGEAAARAAEEAVENYRLID